MLKLLAVVAVICVSQWSVFTAPIPARDDHYVHGKFGRYEYDESVASSQIPRREFHRFHQNSAVRQNSAGKDPVRVGKRETFNRFTKELPLKTEFASPLYADALETLLKFNNEARRASVSEESQDVAEVPQREFHQ